MRKKTLKRTRTDSQLSDMVEGIFELSLGEFREQQTQVKRWIEEQGVTIYNPDAKERTTVQRLLEYMPPLFGDHLCFGGVRLLFLYEQEERQGNDAVCMIDLSAKNEKLTAIGIARWTLQYPEYFQLLFLHELAHAVVGLEHDHDDIFAKCFDRMIRDFNFATNSNLANDYGTRGKK